MNVLKAGREAYRKYGTTLNINYLYSIITDIDLTINKKAGREAYRKYGTTLNINYLYSIITDIDLTINKKALRNRLEYITGVRDNQRDCY